MYYTYTAVVLYIAPGRHRRSSVDLRPHLLRTQPHTSATCISTLCVLLKVAHERRKVTGDCEDTFNPCRRGAKAQASNRSFIPHLPTVREEQPPADDSVVDPTTVQNRPRPTANMALDFAATYKVLVLGDSNVGKTCIVHRYCDERYYDTYISTIGEETRVCVRL